MDDSTIFMQWAVDMLLYEHPMAAMADDCAETIFPSLRAQRDVPLVMEAHAANNLGSSDTDGSNFCSRSVWPQTPDSARCAPSGGSINQTLMTWNFSGVSAHPGSDGRSNLDAAGRSYGGSTPMRRAFEKSVAVPYTQGHVIAERKRRENINRQFIELSTLIPGNKKMDKATILSVATAHIKELHQKIKAVEAGGRNCWSNETVALANKPNENGFRPSLARRTTLPEIDARLSENSVMVRIHCVDKKGVVVKVLTEMEEGLHLIISHTTVIPFVAGTISITITAKVEEGAAVTPEGIIRRLNSILQWQNSFDWN